LIAVADVNKVVAVVDVCSLIKQRLNELGLEQKALAAAAKVTESYVSQLLTRKKLPPAPDRTDIYERMSKFLKLPHDRLAKLADLERKEELKRSLGEPPRPLFEEVRELVLRKCQPDSEKQMRTLFEKQPFGELERLVTQRLLDVVTKLAKEELENENWVHLVARLSDESFEHTHVLILDFLDTDVFNLSPEHCTSFLEPLIETWRIDLATFGMEIVLNRRLAPDNLKRFEFVEREPGRPSEPDPGLEEFLHDPSLSGDVTEEETEFLRNLRIDGRRPTPLYYYRELQNLRDPLHFHRPGSSAGRRATRPRRGGKRRSEKLRPQFKRAGGKGGANER
jgi:transcriptional regulator with XRE-family HTH domain